MSPPRRAAAPSPGRFFQTVHQAFERAVTLAGRPIDCDYVIGGQSVRLRFADAALIPPLTPALAHLAVPANPHQPGLTICLWDGATTGIHVAAPPLLQTDYLARKEVRGYNDERFRTAFDLTGGVLSLLDLERRQACYWVRDARRLPFYECGAPLLTILHWWMRAAGRQVTHAAAVGTATGGVLLAGRGGSGKSTTALACLASDLRYVGDDYCLLALEPTPYAHSLYNSGKLDEASLRRLPELAADIHNPERPGGEKALLFVQRHWPEKPTAGFPLRAVLLPRVTGERETRFVLAARAAALKALAPSTIFQLPGAAQPALQTMAELVRRVPAYQLELGTELRRIPAVIKTLLSELEP